MKNKKIIEIGLWLASPVILIMFIIIIIFLLEGDGWMKDREINDNDSIFLEEISSRFRVTSYGLTKQRCAKVRRVYLDNQWTPRYWDIEEVIKCRNKYYDSSWNEKVNNLEFSDNINDYSPQKCRKLKKLWDNGNWSLRFDPAKVLVECQYKYYFGSELAWNYKINTNPNKERCKKIKKWFLRDSWSPRFGDVAEVSICKQKFYDENWNDKQEFYNKTNVWISNRSPSAWYEEEIVTTEIQSNFKDVWLDSLAWKAANYLFNNWVLWGYSDNTFRWTSLVNRAEAVKFLLLARYWRYYESTTWYYGGNLIHEAKYKDIKKDEWYSSYINVADFHNIANWYEDWTFRPAEWVRRWEFLKMMTETFDLNEYLPQYYTDLEWNWVKQYAWIIDKYNLIPGIWSKLKPGDYMTRGEVSVAIYQYLNKNN